MSALAPTHFGDVLRVTFDRAPALAVPGAE
jgi:hypothetical protein